MLEWKDAHPGDGGQHGDPVEKYNPASQKGQYNFRDRAHDAAVDEIAHMMHGAHEHAHHVEVVRALVELLRGDRDQRDTGHMAGPHNEKPAY